jgi:hypothetical protein
MKNGIRYILADNRYLPDMVRPTGERVMFKFQNARARFLLNHRRDIFLRLQEDGELMEHLRKIEKDAKRMRDNLMEQMLKAKPIPQSLKNTDMLEWVGLMNNYKSSAEEIVMNDLIYPEGTLEELEDLEDLWVDMEKIFREYTPKELERLKMENMQEE